MRGPQVKVNAAILLLLLLPAADILYAQVDISGSVKKSTGTGIKHNSTFLRKSHNGNIDLPIATSLPTAGFRIFNDPLYLSRDTPNNYFSIAGYQYDKTPLHTFTALPSFILYNKNIPGADTGSSKKYLSDQADTLIYPVDHIDQQDHLTILHVLRKIPGIEVNAGGRISFHGQAIQNFYIDGDELPGDHYNPGNHFITADLVSNIQVIENHQPIRALKNAGHSGQVALNLVLTDKARTGANIRGEAGLHFSDRLLYDLGFRALVFRKNYKGIHVLKSNNAGLDLRNNILNYPHNNFNQTLLHDATQEILNVNQPAVAGIEKSRYIFNNNSVLINSSSLFRTPKKLELAYNIYRYTSEEKLFSRTRSVYFLPADRVSYIQSQNLQTNSSLTQFRFRASRNLDQHYWSNYLVADLQRVPQKSFGNLNGNNSSQDLSAKRNHISNEFNYHRNLSGKKVLTFYNYSSYLTKPEQLSIEPGINNVSYFYNGVYYSSVRQKLNIPSLFTHSYVDLAIPGKLFIHSYRAGFTGQWQQLESEGSLLQLNNIFAPVSDSFVNQLNWVRQQKYVKADFAYSGKRLNLSASIPLIQQTMDYSNNNPILAANNARFRRLYFLPAFSIKYATGLNSFLQARFLLNNELATIQDVFSGYILKNYALLVNNLVPARERMTQITSLHFHYGKSKDFSFAHVGFQFIKNEDNSILNTQLENNFQKITLLPVINQSHTVVINASASKFISKISSTIHFKSNLTTGQLYQMQNGTLRKFVNRSVQFSGGIQRRISDRMTAAYAGIFKRSNSKALDINSPGLPVKELQHQFELNILPSDELTISIKGESIRVSQQSTNILSRVFFADFTLSYKLERPKASICFQVLNLANEMDYTSVRVVSNNLMVHSLTIRPRTFSVRIGFDL